MLNKGLILLSAAAFCLTSLSIFLSDAQQRGLATWNIRTWSAIERCRTSLMVSGTGRLMSEDHPVATALFTALMFVIAPLWIAVFAVFLLPSAAGFFGGLLTALDRALDWQDIQVITLLGAIFGLSFYGVIMGARGFLLSAAVIAVAILLVPLSIVEIAARRIAEYDKGPLVALSLLVSSALALIKAMVG